MPSLKEVRNRITSVISTQQITKAMKMVAAAKLRRAQDATIQLRPYAEKLDVILSNVSATIEEGADNIYSTEREINKVLIVSVTSDRGLCGAFNANIGKGVVSLIDEKFKKQHEAGNVDVLAIGSKGAEYLQRRNYNVISDFVDTFQKLNFDNVKVAAEFAMNHFAEGNYDTVYVVYNEFKNVATQVVRQQQFLPIAAQESSDENVTSNEYIFEPSQAYIVKELIPKSLKIQFYKALLESNASEHGARMTAMDKATDNAGELLKDLKLAYNRTRQAHITKEILEIVGGAEALNN